MNRRTFLAALAALPVVGRVFAEVELDPWPETFDEAFSATMSDSLAWDHNDPRDIAFFGTSEDFAVYVANLNRKGAAE